MRLSALAAFLAAASLAPGCATTAPAPPPASAAQPASEAVAAFLEAFDALDSARFDAFFAEDATMFFPAGPFPRERVAGRAPVTAAFRRFFDMARERGATRLGIRPLDLQGQDHGETAVATFHLRGSGNVGRRSIVMRREPAGWRIVHFHASSLEEEAQ